MDINFDNLIHLQHLDAEIDKASLFLKNVPSQIEEIIKKIKISTQIVIKAKEKLAQNQKKRRDLEAEAQDIKPQISKYKRQLNEVKTNREYSFLLKEIEEAQKKIDALEEEIISEMLLADDIEEEIKKAAQKANKEKEKFSKEMDEIHQNERALEKKREELLQEKNNLIPKIPSDQITLYLKIYNKKNGIALSPAKDDFCSMCFMRIRPQMLNELKAEKQIILCENCGRILYWIKKSA